MVTKDYSKSRMRENRTYGSVRGGQSNLIPSTRLTAALPLRVVVSALMGASINAALRQQEKPYNRPDGRGNAIPLWWLAPPPFPPQAGALWMLSYGVMSLQESIERPILPP